MAYRVFEPGIEVNGRTVFTIVDGFKFYKTVALEMLHDRGIGTLDKDGGVVIDRNAWYPQQAWLDVFYEIASKLGDSVLFQIGLKIPENADFPTWPSTVEDAIRSVDIAYHMNHRKFGDIMYRADSNQMLEGIGHYGFSRTETENSVISNCDNPYPCAFDHGILTAVARKYQKTAYVEHMESVPCRSIGGSSCTFRIAW